MKKTTILALLLFTTLTAHANPHEIRLFYQSSEHQTIGDEINLQFNANTPPQPDYTLTLENGLSVSYGDIVLLAGDFYGIPEQPIALGATLEEKRQRFLNAYATLNNGDHATTEVPRILAIVKDEKKQLEDGIALGENPDVIYERMSLQHTIAWNCITGGICLEDHPEMSQDTIHDAYYLYPGRYLKLMNQDFDHFGKEAQSVYKIGHQLALEMAVSASNQHDTHKLAQAYSMNAFASHFLSDSFSSGHMRVPRLTLYQTTRPAALGSLLANAMHNEDSRNGLMVSNERGHTWKTYGDSYYFDPRNLANRDILKRAMQASVDDIFWAYLNGRIPSDTASTYLPKLDALTQQNRNTANTAPMFYWDDTTKKVLRRKQLKNPEDYEWTTEWVAWKTLLELHAS